MRRNGRHAVVVIVLLLLFLHGTLQFVQMTDRVVMYEKDVLLRERLFAHVALIWPIWVQIFLHGVAQLLSLAMKQRLVMARQVALTRERYFATVTFIFAIWIVVAVFCYCLTVEVIL